MLCDFENVLSIGLCNPLQIPDSKCLLNKFVNDYAHRIMNFFCSLLSSLLGPVPRELICMGFFHVLPGPQRCWIGLVSKGHGRRSGSGRKGAGLLIPLALSPCSFRTGSSCNFLPCPDWKYEENKGTFFLWPTDSPGGEKVILTQMGHAQTVSSICEDLWVDRERNIVRAYPVKYNTLVLQMWKWWTRV